MEANQDARTNADIAQAVKDATDAARRDLAWSIYHRFVWTPAPRQDRPTIAKHADHIVDAIVQGMLHD